MLPLSLVYKVWWFTSGQNIILLEARCTFLFCQFTRAWTLLSALLSRTYQYFTDRLARFLLHLLLQVKWSGELGRRFLRPLNCLLKWYVLLSGYLHLLHDVLSGGSEVELSLLGKLSLHMVAAASILENNLLPALDWEKGILRKRAALSALCCFSFTLMMFSNSSDIAEALAARQLQIINNRLGIFIHISSDWSFLLSHQIIPLRKKLLLWLFKHLHHHWRIFRQLLKV